MNEEFSERWVLVYGGGLKIHEEGGTYNLASKFTDCDKACAAANYLNEKTGLMFIPTLVGPGYVKP